MLRLKPVIEGNEAAPTLFFVQGWPDDRTLWNEQVALLAPDYRCVRVDLPNFGSAERVRRGYQTDEIVEAIAECIREVSPNAPVTLIAHDWGAYWGHVVHHRYPDRIDRFVGLDVAPHYQPGFGAVLGIALYQWWLWIAFVIGGPVGDAMTRRFAKWVRTPQQGASLTSWMNYPYRNAWHDLASGRLKRATKGYWPSVPILFVYGEKKPFHFHSQNWLDHVRSQPAGAVVPLPCGHWVPRAPEFSDVLRRWLRDAAPARRREA